MAVVVLTVYPFILMPMGAGIKTQFYSRDQKASQPVIVLIAMLSPFVLMDLAIIVVLDGASSVNGRI